MRSDWKGCYLKSLVIKKLDNKNFVAFSSSVINKSFIGSRVLMHLGNKYKSYKVVKNMIGFRFGEFIVRKKLGKVIHFYNKKVKKK